MLAWLKVDVSAEKAGRILSGGSGKRKSLPMSPCRAQCSNLREMYSRIACPGEVVGYKSMVRAMGIICCGNAGRKLSVRHT